MVKWLDSRSKICNPFLHEDVSSILSRSRSFNYYIESCYYNSVYCTKFWYFYSLQKSSFFSHIPDFKYWQFNPSRSRDANIPPQNHFKGNKKDKVVKEHAMMFHVIFFMVHKAFIWCERKKFIMSWRTQDELEGE